MIKTEILTFKNKAEWLELRKQDVTASDIAAICGCDNFKTALDVWSQKTNRTGEIKDNNIMRRGRWFESAGIMALQEEKPDWQITQPNHYLRDAAIRIGATPDAYAINEKGEKGIVQIKVVNEFAFAENWQFNVPINYQLQTLTEAMLADTKWAILAVLVVGARTCDLEIFEVKRHAEAEAKIVESVMQFWADVDAGATPKIDLSRDAKLLGMINAPNPELAPIDLTGDNELPELVAEQEKLNLQKTALNADLKPISNRLDEIKTSLLVKLNGATVGQANGFQVQSKLITRKGYQVEPSQYSQLKIKYENGASYE